jgi:exodeoxyribonuclease V
MGEIQLTNEQQAAVDRVIYLARQRQPFISMSGSAGTGKSTLVKVLRDRLGESYEVVVVTPTNKAATVLKSKGVPAATYFSVFFTLLELRPAPGAPKKMVFRPNYMIREEELGPNKLDFADIIIVEEASMVTCQDVRHLERMCNRLILIGDGDQLPPVNDRINPEGFFCTRAHDAQLTTVHRNSGAVLQLATAIRTWPTNDPKQPWHGLGFDDHYPELDFKGLYLADAPQIICWRNKVRREVNLRCRAALHRTGALPVPGDLLICRNNHSDVLLNGTQCILESIHWRPEDQLRTARVVLQMPDGEEVMADMDIAFFLGDQPPSAVAGYLGLLAKFDRSEDEGAQLTYGYAITAHASQGGEWDSVVVIDESQAMRYRGKADTSDQMDVEEQLRRWFYTAVSRAKSAVWIANEQWTKY